MGCVLGREGNFSFLRFGRNGHFVDFACFSKVSKSRDGVAHGCKVLQRCPICGQSWRYEIGFCVRRGRTSTGDMN